MSSDTVKLSIYSRPAILFHWVIVLLLALAYLAINVRGPNGTYSSIFWTNIHFLAGFFVFVCAVLRVLWRLWHGVPPEIQESKVAMFGARAMHLVLYLFIFAQPILGILLVNSGGSPVRLAGIHLNIQLYGEDMRAHHAIHTVHVLLGQAFYWVIGLHAIAAVIHHFVLKDETMRRMLGVRAKIR